MLRWFTGLLAVFCLLAFVRIEWLDHQAGGAIHQKLAREPEVRWVIYKTLDAEVRLRNDVGHGLMTLGVALHVAALGLVFISLFRQVRDGPWRSGWTVFASLGVAFLVFAFSRRYFVALGW